MTVSQLGNVTNYDCSPALLQIKLLKCAAEKQQQQQKSPRKGNGFAGGGHRQILSNLNPS